MKRNIEFLKVTMLELIDTNQQALALGQKRNNSCLCEVQSMEEIENLFNLPLSSIDEVYLMKENLADSSLRHKLVNYNYQL